MVVLGSNASQEEGDFLSDPDAFVASYCDQLDQIVDKLEEDMGATASLMEIDREDPGQGGMDTSQFAELNHATRRKLLVKVQNLCFHTRLRCATG